MSRLPCIAGLALAAALIVAVVTRGQDSPASSPEALARDLDGIARTASVMVDGDLCMRIMTQRSLGKMFAQDPKDPWAASDNFDVNQQPYIQTKKTLIRLSRLVAYPCDVNLWMPFAEKPDTVQVLIRNANEWSQFWTWGMLTQPMPVEMKRVFETGKREKVMRLRGGLVSVLAPVYNSLGDIVALVEAVAPEPGARLPQVHAMLRSK